MKKSGQQYRLEEFERDYVDKVQRDTRNKVLPLYSTYLVISAGCFGYFILTEQNQCYAKDGQASAVLFDGSQDVSKQFHLCSSGALIILILCALMHFLQTKDGMYYIMRPYILLSNTLMILWFLALQYYRLMPNGRACSGDFLDSKKLPDDYSKIYLGTQGTFFLVYIVIHYIAILTVFLASRRITNKHKQEFEKKRALEMNQIN